MKKFITMNEGAEIILNGKVEEYGILENEYNEYELCEKENEESFTIVDVIYENGTYYVDFTETSKWFNSNIELGNMYDLKQKYQI